MQDLTMVPLSVEVVMVTEGLIDEIESMWFEFKMH